MHTHNVLILGKGFLGQRLYRRLKLSPNINPHILAKKDLDYTDVYNLNTEEFPQPDIIINASGYTGKPNVDACEVNKEECWDLNTRFPLDLYNYCQYLGVLMIHISSGCIYNGYDKEYTEEDQPDFGLFSDESSFYSKSKHAAEIFMNDHSYLINLRVRIPFTSDNTSRNYINKLKGYDQLISTPNSITCVEELSDMLQNLITTSDIYTIPFGTYNVVNPEPVSAKEVTELMCQYGLENPNWEFIELSDLNTRANRSNCVLSTEKLNSAGLGFKPTLESLEVAIKKLSTHDKIL
jgi:dTDP-4-dehydrorhamnose reductase